MGPSPGGSCHPAVETGPWVFVVTAAENNIWRALIGQFPGDPLDVCGTECLGGREWWAGLWLTGMSSWKVGDYSFACVETKYLEVTTCQAVKMKINSQGIGEWRSTQWGSSDNGKEGGGSGRGRVGRKKRGETESGGGVGEEREEETNDTGSLSQTLSDSSVCSVPRRLSCHPRCENLVRGWGEGGRRVVEVGGEGGTPAFRRLVEEGKPHGKRPVQGLSLWQITTLRERNKQTKQKTMRNVLRSCLKCNGLYFREDFSYQKCAGCSTSWHRRQLGRCGNPRACETRTKQEASCCLEERLLLVFLRRNGGKVFTEMAKSSPMVHLAGSLIRIDFCFSVYLSPLPALIPPFPPPPRPPRGELRHIV